MKCPNCGVSNGKTNKYCRECGTRLDVLASAQTPPETNADEVGLGEELFKVIELFEAGDLDSALEKGAKLAEANPGSASAHSIVALVYERKAEQELAEGDEERSHNFLKLAIDHYEEIIDLNPDSAADREKLAGLRLKLTGNSVTPAGESRFDLVQTMKAVPPRWWVPGGAFLVVLFLVIFLSPSSQPKPQPTGSMRRESRPLVAVKPAEPAAPQLKVYTFSPTQNNAPSGLPQVPAPVVNTPKPRISVPEVRPVALPKIDQELTLVAQPKAPAKKPVPEAAKPADKPAPEKEVAPSGDSLLAQAIRLHDQGKLSEAIGTANQAVVLYQGEIDAGRNTEAASRGIKNAHSLISTWQK